MMLMVVFWEVGGGYGGFVVEQVGGVMVRERELLRRERDAEILFWFNRVSLMGWVWFNQVFGW